MKKVPFCEAKSNIQLDFPTLSSKYFLKNQPEIHRCLRFLTDDRDEKRRNELVIAYGGNGDWYVSVVPEGQGCIGRSVRVCTSGGASTQVPGLGPAIANAFRALISAGDGHGVTLKTK